MMRAQSIMTPPPSAFPDEPSQVASTSLPDVATESRTRVGGTLDKVGMTDIEVPVRFRDDDGNLVMCPAKADAFVSLDDAKARGVHMSRLFLNLQETLSNDELHLSSIRRMLEQFVASHTGISRASHVAIRFDLPVRRRALISDNKSWRNYPVKISGDLRGEHFRFVVGVTVAYSSTCPCSAALARQLIQEKFRSDFADHTAVTTDTVATWLGKESSIMATPHSQRSYAHLQVEVADVEHAPTFVQLIDMVEDALRTPVQAAVKREDEQEFARLNGQNLMFCEDAGRKLKKALEQDNRIKDFRVEAVHVESLHPHNAVSIVVKGVPGGFRA
jgi:GTP cyclohydrolase IB